MKIQIPDPPVISAKSGIKKPEVSIAIITWEAREDLRTCLNSLYETVTAFPFEVIVVDNHSRDGSGELVESSYPDIHLIRNKKNIGVARARNQAIDAAKGRYILLLDVDTKVQAGAIDKLVEFANENQDAGIIGSKLVDGEDNLQHTCRQFPSILTYIFKKLNFMPFFEQSRRLREHIMADWDHSQVREVDYVVGACQLIRREVIKDVGQLDERFFYGPEDVDFCLRAHLHGWKIYYFPHATVVHYSNNKHKKPFSKQTFKHLWGLFYFFQKHGYLFHVKSQDYAVIMPRGLETTLLVLVDFAAIVFVFFVWSALRGMLGVFTLSEPVPLLVTSLFVFIYWFLLFFFFGLYRAWYAYSRFDEVLTVFKAVTIGALIIFFVTANPSDLSSAPKFSRLLIVTYWFLMSAVAASARSVLRTVQRRLLEAGIGLRRTIIVGSGKETRELFDKVAHFPALGYRVVGFVSNRPVTAKKAYKGVPVLGNILQLSRLIDIERIEDVLIALNYGDQKHVMEVLNQCADKEVKLKITPDLYGTIMGRARTNQIYGTTLIEILPQHMQAWEQKMKRLLDIVVSASILLVGLPVWLLVAIIIRLETPGHPLYSQERTGLRGKAFKIYKFRSMVSDAEKKSGPTWAQKDDMRVTRVGKFIRQTRLDEIPQFWNVLRGDMSLIGPRPERPFFVEQLRQKFPLYSRRLRIRPGITGWAQVKGDYDTTIENVQQKIQFDLFYLENMSLRMDFKIMLMTVYVILARKGQ
ncbi:MAG: glycosyltransferase [Calditrichaeota bacterium]|nr:MAG: glycosyltransferase [Calditrichota bacterium]